MGTLAISQFAALGVDTTVFAAFGVGLLSFFSPCVLPLVPGYLSTISGTVAAEGFTAESGRNDSDSQSSSTGRQAITATLVPALLFVLAFTTIFMALGLSATALGQTLATNRDVLRKIAGVMIALMGIFMLVSIAVPYLNRDWHPQKLIERAGAGGPLVAGAAFAIAWTPCTGPTLGAIFTAAGTKEDLAGGAILLLFYSAGLAVPFLATAAGLGAMTRASDWVKRHYPAIITTSAVILIAFGVLIFTNQFFVLNIKAQQWTQDLGINF